MGASTGGECRRCHRLAKEMGPGHTIVTILCDYGTRYASRLFNRNSWRRRVWKRRVG